MNKAKAYRELQRRQRRRRADDARLLLALCSSADCSAAAAAPVAVASAAVASAAAAVAAVADEGNEECDEGGGGGSPLSQTRRGATPEMFKRQHYLGQAAAGPAAVVSPPPALAARSRRGVGGGRVHITSDELRCAALGEPVALRNGAASSLADARLAPQQQQQQPPPFRDDRRPATTAGVATTSATTSPPSAAVAFASSSPASVRRDAAAMTSGGAAAGQQPSPATLRNGRRLSVASGSGSSARSNDRALRGSVGPAVTADGSGGNNHVSSLIGGGCGTDSHKHSPRTSSEHLPDDTGGGGVSDPPSATVQFPSASKMRQILSEIDSQRVHHGQSQQLQHSSDERLTGIMKKPPAAPQQWGRGYGGSGANGFGVSGATVLPKSNATKTSVTAAARASEGLTQSHGQHVGATRRAAISKQVSFIDTYAGDRNPLLTNGTSLHGAIGNGATMVGGASAVAAAAAGTDQPLLLTSRNLEMYTSLLASSALSQPSAANEDRVLQWVREHQHQLHQQQNSRASSIFRESVHLPPPPPPPEADDRGGGSVEPTAAAVGESSRDAAEPRATPHLLKLQAA